MTPERWRLVDEVLAQVLELAAEEQEQYLDERCAGDPELRARVEELMRAEAKSSGFLEQPLEVGEWLATEPGSQPGQTLGPYRLLERLGSGGMAEVYRAVRADDAYHREVAIKLIRAGLEGGSLRQRFLRERQMLAGLEHEGIARLYDGGTDGQGRPYLVMELVEGQRIDAYCDALQLGLAGRLQLFLELCDAVQFAHRNLLVHRDLKPSNVLVTAEGSVKLLDFGIAKHLQPDGEHTRVGDTPLSLFYASPEQLRGEPVTTASDVFSLGVLLFELLSGSRPFVDAPDSTPTPVHELAVARSQLAPPLMSEALATAEDLEQRAEKRGVATRELRRRLAGDLDSIVAKAMEPQEAQRYTSVEQLVADLLRYQEQRPVLATRRGAVYRSMKFARRHRMGLFAAALLLMLGLAFVVSQVTQTRRMARERDKVSRAMDFMVDLFAVSRPSAPLGSEIPARQLLEQAARRVRVELKQEPEVQATLLDTLGRIYSNMGLVESAEGLLRQALELRRQHSEGAPELAHTLRHMANAAAVRNDDERALRLYDEAVTAARSRRGVQSGALAQALRDKSWWLIQTSRYEEAESTAREAIALASTVPPRREDVAIDQQMLATILQATGRGAEARPIAERVLALRREALGEDHPRIASSLETLGEILREAGEVEESVRLQQRALAIRRQTSAPYDPELLLNLHSLALAQFGLGRDAEAEALLREELAQLEVLFPGADHLGKGSALFNLAGILAERGQYADALDLAQEDLEMRRRLFGEEHPRVGPSWLNVGHLQREVGELQASERSLRIALDLYHATRPPGHPGRPMPKMELGATLCARGQHGEAESLLREASRELAAAHPANHPRLASSSVHLGACLTLQERYSEAEPLLLRGHELLHSRGDRTPGLARVRRELVKLYSAWGKEAEVERIQALAH